MDDNYRMGEVKEHLEKHITYPASKEAIAAACNNMAHLSEDDKNWVKENLPDGTYQTPDEVKRAMKIK